MDQSHPPDLILFTTDTTYKKIISYMKAVHQFIINQLFGNAFSKCIMKRFIFDETNLVPNSINQDIFNRKWEENQRNFDEASCTAKYRRDLSYEDKLVLTLFYVLYTIELYDEYTLEEDEKKIYTIVDTISIEHNEMGQLYMSLYKQLHHCCIMKENTMIISPEKSKEYFII
jgi:hypothetical protein